MKRTVAIVISMILAVSLAGCKSEEAKNADAMIDAIGEVTLESEEAITAAEEAVDELSAEDKEDVNVDKLTEAREAYEQLVLEDKAKKVEEAIDAIGEVTLESGPAIESAQEAYDDADSEVRELVANYGKIEAARAALHQLEIKDEASKIEEAINVIGEVQYTDESLTAIEKAEKAYNNSSEEVRQLVSNDDAIGAAREKYHSLEVEAKAREIEAKIDALGEVTLESKPKVDEARNAYAAASEEVKAAVGNYDVLTAAQETLNRLTAQAVADTIDSLDNITAENGASAIADAKTAYNALPDELKSLVTNYGKIAEAEQKLQSLKEQRIGALKGKMRASTDKVRGITWYEHSSMPKYIDTRSYVFPYIGYDTTYGFVWLRVKTDYYGSDWIFYKTIIFSVDGKNTTVTMDYFDIDREVVSGDVCEVGDFSPTDAQLDMLRSIVNSKETIIRFMGDSHYKDITLSASDKKAIGEVLELYDLMLEEYRS